jgi:diaminopimelate decarboxylase
MPGFERGNQHFLCDGVAAEELAASFGTPLYVYSRSVLTSNYLAYDRAFAPVPHRICYSLKANASQALLRILASLGSGADIVSGGELLAALRAGFPPERIVFSGVGKTDAELQLALAKEIGEFNAESEDEIVRLSALAAREGRRARVTLRVNPDIDARSHPYISTGLRENKFGVPIERAPEILRHAQALPGIDVAGVQCHIGSQMTELSPVEEAVGAIALLSRRLMAEGFRLDTIDIGGGLGIDYDGSAGETMKPAALAARIMPLLRDLPLKLLLEPGRSIVGGSGVLLTRVIGIKENRGKQFVIVDAGMNDLLRPSLYDAYHRIEPAENRGGEAVRVDVVGPVCESGDFLARDREIERVGPGDLLVVRDTGAYGFCMASTYNMRPRPAEVLAEDGQARLIRRRETFEDLVATDIG